MYYYALILYLAKFSVNTHTLTKTTIDEENKLIEDDKIIGGGNTIALDGKIYADMALPIAGLMSDQDGEEIVKQNEIVRNAIYNLGVLRMLSHL